MPGAHSCSAILEKARKCRFDRAFGRGAFFLEWSALVSETIGSDSILPLRIAYSMPTSIAHAGRRRLQQAPHCGGLIPSDRDTLNSSAARGQRREEFRIPSGTVW